MNRTLALMQALGWQGGTIHQVSAETGCSVGDLLYGKVERGYALGTDHNNGWLAGRNNSVGYNRKLVFPKFKGNIDFWLGVAEGLMQKATGR